MARSDPMIHIRLAQDVKDFLSSSARKQERTMGAQITFLLRKEMEKEKAPDHALGKLSGASQK